MKKALGFLIFASMGMVLSSMILVVTIGPVDFKETIGIKQYNLLKVNEDIHAVDAYLNLAVPYAADRAEDSIYLSSGIPASSFGSGRAFRSPCGTHIYNMYTSESTECLPEFRNAFELYTEQNIKRFLDSYKDITLMSQLFVDVTSLSDQQTRIVARGSRHPVALSSKITFIEEETIYPRGVLGGYGNERTIICKTGYCFSEVADYYHQLYELAGSRFSYVSGGESPYTYEDTLKDQKENERSFFIGVELTESQEGQASLTEPGFDSSGWIWWVGKHAGVLELSQRKDILTLYSSLEASATELCKQGGEKDCTLNIVNELVEPGDLLFVEENSIPTHVMIYLGNNRVSHSQPGIGLLNTEMPSIFLNAQESNILAVYRPSYVESGQEYFLEPQEGEGEEVSSCSLAIDFTQIQAEAIRDSRRDVLEQVSEAVASLNQRLVDTNQEQSVQAAHAQFTNIPVEYIKAIIMTEVGYGALAFNYLSGTTTSRQRSNIVGPMQVDTKACDDVNRINDQEICDHALIKRGGYDGAANGILSGTGYLNYLVRSAKYLDEQNPNLYFLALAYNAGPGSLNIVLEAASERTGIPETQLEWKDIEYRDVASLRRSLGWDRDKLNEIYEYPNLVAAYLSGQCDGDIFAQYRSGQSNMFFTPIYETKSSLDLVRMELVENFVDEVLTCDNNLDVCVSKKVDDFNSQYGSQVLIQQQGEAESFAYEFADQVLDCLKNDQKNCLCKFDLPLKQKEIIGPREEVEVSKDFQIPFMLEEVESKQELDSQIEDVVLRVDENGILSAGSFLDNEFRVEETIYRFPLSLNSIYSGPIFDTLYLRPNFIANEFTLEFRDLQSLGEALKEGFSFGLLDGAKNTISWQTGNQIDALVMSKEGDFVFGTGTVNDRQRLIIEYAKQYLGTEYHINSKHGPLRDCRAIDAQAGRCRTQCGSFVSSVFLYTLGVRDEYGPDIVPRGNGNQKCDSPNILEKFTDPTLLEVGDLFSSNGQSPAARLYGHTGIFVGWGSVRDPARYRTDGTPYCYKEFVENPLDGSFEPVFIHSIGPVCYNTLNQLQVDQGRDQMLFCRHKLLETTREEELSSSLEETEEETELPLAWFAYKEEEHASLLCRENKHYYRFQAEFSNGQEPVNFSVYINDSIAPTILESRIDQRKCLTQDVIALEWSYPKDEEKIYRFDIQVCDESCSLPVELLTSLAKPTQEVDPTKQTEINQLFVRETSTKRIYTYLFNRIIKDGENGVERQLLKPSMTYTVDILGYDHYLNTPVHLEPQLSIETPMKSQTESFVEANFGGIITDDLADSFFNAFDSVLGECTDAEQFDIGLVYENVYGDLSPDDEVEE